MRTATAALILFAVGCSSSKPQPSDVTDGGGVKIHGPFVHENLAVYVLEDPAARDSQEFLTLEEGIAAGVVSVTEKEQAEVRELQLENRSEKPLFVQAGDVVKGGQQDRTISADFVVPPNSGKTGIPSFCVEHGRWTQGKVFTPGMNGLAGNRAKLAVQLSKDQREVWDAVKEHKEKMVANNCLTPSETDSVNEESERKEIVEKLKKFEAALGEVLRDRPQAVGILVAVNGTVQGADRYVSPSLFRKLYPRLLRGAAIEAIANPSKEAKPVPTAEVARSFLASAREGTKKEETLREDLRSLCTENAKSVLFTCQWKEQDLHVQTIEK